MSEVKSLNPYALLGNTSDQDSDREPEPPTKAIDKPTARSGKRDAPKAAPAAPVTGTTTRGGSDRRRGGFTGSEAAFRDRTSGRSQNREKPTEDGEVAGRARGRGRGPRGPRRGGDRRDRTGQQEHQKQTDQAWGEPTGEGEWADERAGEAIAKAEVKEGGFDANADTPVDGDGNRLGPEPELEDTNKSYADYLAEQAAKRLEGLGLKEARQANEGAKSNKKWDAAKALEAQKGGEEYFAGSAEKAGRQRERKQKDFVDIDFTFKEPPREGGRGRGRGRGHDGPSRGRGAPRGDFAPRSRGRGGAPRGRGGADGPTVNTSDESAFPSLGGK